MHLEATKNADAALAFYNKVLAVEPTNVPVIKRKITLLKSIGKVGDAIHELVSYLDTFYTDADAWLELAELYQSMNAFERANYCFGEAVLINPHNHFNHLQYADSFYTLSLQQPGASHLDNALREYLRAIELCDNLLRGFCGVKACCSTLMRSPKEIPLEELKQLDALATDQLAKLTRTKIAIPQELEFAQSLIEAPLVK
jgi:tetratricopeptide (TPR) repeat protein